MNTTLKPTTIRRLRKLAKDTARKLLPISNGAEFRSYWNLVFGNKKPRPGSYRQ